MDLYVGFFSVSMGGGAGPVGRVLRLAVWSQGRWGSVVLDCPRADTEDDHPILRKEVEAAVQSLKEKSAGADNIPEELIQAGRENVVPALTTICNKIWQSGEWPTPWAQSLVITLTKKGNLQQGAQRSRYLTYGSSVRNISSTSKRYFSHILRPVIDNVYNVSLLVFFLSTLLHYCLKVL